MTDLKNYLDDGACHQARATLAYLQAICFKNKNTKAHVARWENCREQGYVVSLYLFGVGEGKQLNIAFFEHRNSDSICAVKWEQRSINSLTIDTAEFVGVYKDKWDVSHEVPYGEAYKMADWIAGELLDFEINNESD